MIVSLGYEERDQDAKRHADERDEVTQLGNQGQFFGRVRVIGIPVRIGASAEKVGVNDCHPVNHVIVREKSDTPVVAQE